jgi:hypothetical protein
MQVQRVRVSGARCVEALLPYYGLIMARLHALKPMELKVTLTNIPMRNLRVAGVSDG